MQSAPGQHCTTLQYRRTPAVYSVFPPHPVPHVPTLTISGSSQAAFEGQYSEFLAWRKLLLGDATLDLDGQTAGKRQDAGETCITLDGKEVAQAATVEVIATCGTGSDRLQAARD